MSDQSTPDAPPEEPMVTPAPEAPLATEAPTEADATATGPSSSGPSSPGPWGAAPAGSGWDAPPAPSPAGPTRVGLRQFVTGAAVGGLIGALVAGGVFVAVRDDTTTKQATTPVPTTSNARNTSVFTEPKDLQGVLHNVEPAVVAIRTGAAVDPGLFGGSSGSRGGAGTGFVIGSDGVIATNNHVVADANGKIEVGFTDGTNKTATVVGRDASVDLAVLKVDANGLPVAKLGDSDKLQVGDEVIAIGNALALEGGPSVTRGIISALNRQIDTEVGTTLFNVIQTDAAINPGNSGGPLVNSAGEVVGINTAIANPGEAQNVGFAISISNAKSFIDELRQGRTVQIAFLGVDTQSVTPAIANELGLTTQTGAVVRRVTPGGPAEKAGIQRNDVIRKVGDADVKTKTDVAVAVRKHRPGDKVDVVIQRGGKDQTVSVTLAPRPQSNG